VERRNPDVEGFDDFGSILVVRLDNAGWLPPLARFATCELYESNGTLLILSLAATATATSFGFSGSGLS
jgi:hypothetical protein